MNEYVLKLFGGLDGLNNKYKEDEEPIEKVKKTYNKEYQREWKAQNKDHVKEYFKKYYEDHKDIMKNNQKRRYEKVKDSLEIKQGQHDYYLFKRYT